jgi:hypothetical protein
VFDMTQIITGIIMFMLGAALGVGWMCLLSSGKQADEETLALQEVDSYE